MAGRILLIEALSSERIGLTAKLSRARYAVTTASTPADIDAAFARGRPNLVILGAVSEGLRDMVSGLSTRFDGPILHLCGDGSPETRLRALQNGAREVLRRPLSENVLLAHIRRLLRDGDIQRERKHRAEVAHAIGMAETSVPFAHKTDIALITPAPDTADWQTGSCNALDLISAEDALDVEDGRPVPSAYVLDASGDQRDAMLQLLPELRSRSHSRHAEMLLIHAPLDDDCAVAAMNTGASDLLPADATSQELDFRLAALMQRKAIRDVLRRSADAALRLASTDHLTDISNRRYSDGYLANTITRARQSGESFGLLMIDIDHFKAVNDTHGHAVGDEVLIQVAQRLQNGLRDSDMIARYGGEEFLIVLTATDPEHVGPAADRLRRLISDQPIKTSDRSIAATVSIGVCIADPTANPIQSDKLLASADAALYCAKKAGRNRIKMAGDRGLSGGAGRASTRLQDVSRKRPALPKTSRSAVLKTGAPRSTGGQQWLPFDLPTQPAQRPDQKVRSE